MTSVRAASVLFSGLALAAAFTATGLAGTYGDDLAFLKRHTEVVELTNANGARVAVVPAWQGRVMTSTDTGAAGPSFGWVNRELIASRKLQPHINPFGGEDRFWMGPEGGQFAIFFSPGKKFEYADWQTPAVLDTDAYPVKGQAKDQISFQKECRLINHSGTVFDVLVYRTVRLLATDKVWTQLRVPSAKGVTVVGYESLNRITNIGTKPWTKQTGLLSIWILGMFNAAPEMTVVVPIKPGPEAELGPRVNADYFGPVPAERLATTPRAVFFRGDGKYRSKIGVGPARAKPVMGSYDPTSGVLTIVQYTLPAGAKDYVNSQWKMQDDPFGGDVVNSYSDDGKLGAFYELESSSPAVALSQGKSIEHTHRTIHLRGKPAELDKISKAVLGVGLDEIQGALKAK